MTEVRLSKTFTLQLPDFVRGGILAVLTSVLTIVQQTLQNGSLTFNWVLIGTTAVSAFIAYLVKNYFEPAKVITTVDSNAKAEVANKEIKKVV